MQVFSEQADPLLRAALVAGALALVGAGVAMGQGLEPPYVTDRGEVVEQPVPFSHAHHVGQLGIACLYCHADVEVSPFAGMPPAHTCMSCHSQLYTDAGMLEPVRRSYREGRPIAWARVYDLPDFVFFDHRAHVRKGVGCESCHGRVDRMPLMSQAEGLEMKWCLDCHRDPAPHLRPPDAIFAMGWERPPDPAQSPEALAELYGLATAHLTDCSTCHR
ncbi:MAG: cytochrome c3 family protein [Deltaproteobacteria bacterium]|nr:cytochrome c3 family protein [Deltaproteobacteria bacterium]